MRASRCVCPLSLAWSCWSVSQGLFQDPFGCHFFRRSRVVVHVVAVAFAAFSLRLSTKPAAPQFLYGYERITFFSAGFEGAMIIVAAIAILVESIGKWMAGLQLGNLGGGTLLVLGAGIVNAGLGYYLLRIGRRTEVLDLAHGKVHAGIIHGLEARS